MVCGVATSHMTCVSVLLLQQIRRSFRKPQLLQLIGSWCQQSEEAAKESQVSGAGGAAAAVLQSWLLTWRNLFAGGV